MELQFKNIEAGYNGRTVLHDLHGTVPAAAKIAVIGPNGCGKSTLLRALMGVLPSKGTVLLEGVDVGRNSPMQRNKMGIGCLRQGVNVFPSLTGRANLEMAYVGERSAMAQRMDEVVDFFPVVKQVMNRRAGELSGGIRQSLALTMVLMNDPKVLLLDEPLAGLAPKAADQVIAALCGIHQAKSASLVIVEHRLPHIADVVDAVWVMRDGRFFRKTTEAGVLSDPETLADYFRLALP